jgi:hypothetical protein
MSHESRVRINTLLKRSRKTLAAVTLDSVGTADLFHSGQKLNDEIVQPGTITQPLVDV